MKNNYNNMSIQELVAEEEKLRKELFNMNFLNKVGQLQNNSSIRTTKKNIARVKTALQAKKLAGAKEYYYGRKESKPQDNPRCCCF